jgi:hypothetical protein
MTEQDCLRIETELQITLPAEYRKAVVNFPLRFDMGNSASFLWDDADALIRENQELRTTKQAAGWFEIGHVGWPHHFYFIGGDVEFSAVLDLRQTPCRVLEVEHWDVSGYDQPYQAALTFTAWLDRYLDDFRNDGIDLNAAEVPVWSVPVSCLYLLVTLLMVVLGACGALWLLQIFHHR